MTKIYTDINLKGNNLGGAVLEEIEITQSEETGQYESTVGYSGQFARSGNNPYYCKGFDETNEKYIWDKLESNSGGETGIDDITLSTSTSNVLGSSMTGSVNIGVLKNDQARLSDLNVSGDKLPTSKTIYSAINSAVSEIDLSSKTVTIEKTTTAEDFNYTIKQGGSSLSPVINVPKQQDYSISLSSSQTSSGTLYTLSQRDQTIGTFTVPSGSSIASIEDYGPSVETGEFTINNISNIVNINIPNDITTITDKQMSVFRNNRWESYNDFTAEITTPGILSIGTASTGKFKFSFNIKKHYIKITLTNSNIIFILDRVITSSEIFGPITTYPTVTGSRQTRVVLSPYYPDSFNEILVYFGTVLQSSSSYQVSGNNGKLILNFSNPIPTGTQVKITTISNTYLVQHISDGSFLTTLISESQPASIVYSDITVNSILYDYYEINHNFGNTNVIVSVYDSDGNQVLCDVISNDPGKVKLIFDSTIAKPTTFRVVVSGSYSPYTDSRVAVPHLR